MLVLYQTTLLPYLAHDIKKRVHPFFIQATLVITDGPGYTFRARKPSNGRRMSGRPVDYWCVSYLEIFHKKNSGITKKHNNFPNTYVHEFSSSLLCLSCSPLFNYILLSPRFFLFLHLLTKQCCASRLSNDTKLQQCRTRGKKSRGFISNNLKHMIFWSFNFEQEPRVLDRLDEVDTLQDR